MQQLEYALVADVVELLWPLGGVLPPIRLRVRSEAQLAQLGQLAVELVEQMPVVQQVLMLTQRSLLLALLPVVVMVADSSVEVPLPLLEQVGKFWIYSDFLMTFGFLFF